MKILLYTLFTFFTLLGHAQNPQASHTKDSKEIVISKKLKDAELDIDGDSKKKEILFLQLKQQSEELNYTRGILQSGDKLMSLYSSQGRYKEVGDLANELKKMLTDKKDPEGMASSIYRQSALNLGYLGLADASLKDFRTAIKYAETIENKDYRLYSLSLCYQNINVYFTTKQLESKKYGDSTLSYLNKSQELAKQIRDDNGIVSNSLKYNQIGFNAMRIGMYYLRDTDTPGNLEKAEKHLLEGAKIYENRQYNIPPDNKIMMLNQLSWLYLEKKDYQASIDHAKHAMALEKQYRDPYHRVESFEFLASSYTETGDKEKSKYYMDRYTFLKDSLNLVDMKNANISMKEMVSEVDSEHRILSQRQWVLISLLALGIITTIIFWRKRNKTLSHNYEKIIEKLKQEPLSEPSKLPTSKTRSYISDQTERELLLKLEAFENSDRFIKADLTIGYLSTKFDTNPKYLSEIIKNSRSNNFNNYINDLRINYIIHKLYNEPKYRDYKIAYLAEKCGFASSQVFNMAFRKSTGVTPSYFIKNLINENDLPEN